MTVFMKNRKVCVLRVRWVYKLAFPGTRQYYDKPVSVVQKLIKDGLEQQNNTELYPLRIDNCSYRHSFAKACIHFNTYSLDIKGNYQKADYGGKTITPVVQFQTVFEKGYTMLQRHVSEDTYKSDSESDEDYEIVGRWRAFYRLCEFLLDKEYHEAALKNKNVKKGRANELLERTETYSAVLLTSHLLLKLMPGDNYVISSDYSDKPVLCPCHNDCGLLMKYGSTGLGFEKLWYGHPDIVMFSSMSNVLILNEKSRELAQSMESMVIDKKENSTEILEVDVNHGHCDEQVISQTITFSLCKSDENFSLVPTILLTPSNFCVYFYDLANDVLLRMGSPEPLWDADDECKFNMSAILKIWMVINHARFKPSLSENQISKLRNSANFHHLSAKEGLTVKELSEKVGFKSNFNSADCYFDLTKRSHDIVEILE